MNNGEQKSTQDKSSECLAATVVIHRVLGSFEQEAREAMIELMIRRKEGDSFDYESFIAKNVDDMPKPETPQIVTLLKSIGLVGAAR